MVWAQNARPPNPRTLKGLARLIARPAYDKQVRREPLLRRAIPVVIAAFLTASCFAAFWQVATAYERAREDAREEIFLVARMLAGELRRAARSGETIEAEATLADLLSRNGRPRARERGQAAAVTDEAGAIVAVHPPGRFPLGMALSELIRSGGLLHTFAEEAEVQAVLLSDGSEVYATVHRLDDGFRRLAVIRPMEAVLAPWIDQTVLVLLVLITTGGVSIGLGAAFHRQLKRAREADAIYETARARLDTALSRGRSGLWDWDLAHGRIFWSDSMYEILGRPPHDDLLCYGDVAALAHPDDGDLYDVVVALIEEGRSTIDRTFRMRHADGTWIWLRARAELVETPGEPERHLIGIAVDITEQRRLQERTATADMRLRDAIEAISETFALWDVERRLVLCNSKYQQVYRLPDDAVVPGMPQDDVAKSGLKPVVRVAFERPAIRNADARTYTAELDGRWLQINERRTKDGGLVSVGADITALKEHEEKLMESERRLTALIADLRRSRQVLTRQAKQLADLKTRAEEASNAKSQFLANISHELRTPLNAIINFSEIMGSGMFGALGSTKYEEYCHDIRQSGLHLLDVINDILDMSRIEAGRRSIDVEAIALAPVIEEVTRIIATRAEERGVTLDFGRRADVALAGDRRALKQILLNLLSNAVKFTPEGGRVRLRERRVGERVLITIADTGIGIPRTALKRLGRPFEQVENELTRSHAGSGLGLAISRSLVALHGGRMRIRSIEKQGTIVAVRLPRRPPHAQDQAA